MLKKHFALIIVFCCLLIFNTSIGQTDSVNSNSFSLQLHRGFIFPHREHVRHLIRKHISAAQFSFMHNMNGEKRWHQYFNFPRSGFSLIYIDFANPQQLGFALAAMPIIDLPMNRKRGIFFRMGYGLGYISKPFRQSDNYKNNVVGSNLNAAIQFAGTANLFTGEKNILNTSVSFTHFSNGSYQVPNLGINNVALSLDYFFNGKKSSTYKYTALNDSLITSKKIKFELLWGGSWKENYPPGYDKVFAHTTSINCLKVLGHRSMLGLGFNYFYDPILPAFNDESKENQQKKIRMGIILYHSLLLGRAEVVSGMGVYVYDHYKKDGNFYHRVGLVYHLSKKLLAMATLKAHYAKADYFEFGGGWRFN